MIFSHDHEPPHVHAISPNGSARVMISNAMCVKSRGYSKKDIRQIEAFIKSKRVKFMEAWNEIHN